MKKTTSLSSSAHSVLQYMISRAVLENKTGSSKIRIPLAELQEEHGGPGGADPNGVVLEVEFKTSWDEGDTDELEFSIDEGEF